MGSKICMLLIALVAIPMPAAAVGNIDTNVVSDVTVDNSYQDAKQTASDTDCVVEGNDSSACNDSCHGDDACSGGDGGDGGEGCSGTTIQLGDGCNGGDGGDGGDGNDDQDGEEGEDGG